MTNTAIMSVCVCGGGGGGHRPTVVSTVGNYESTYLRPVKFRQISFSGCKVEVENVSANQMPGRPSLFSDRPENYSRGTGRWVRHIVRRFTTHGTRRLSGEWDQSDPTMKLTTHPKTWKKKIILRAAPLFADRNGGQNPVLKVLSHVCEFQADPRFVSIFVEIPSVVSEKKS